MKARPTPAKWRAGLIERIRAGHTNAQLAAYCERLIEATRPVALVPPELRRHALHYRARANADYLRDRADPPMPREVAAAYDALFGEGSRADVV